MHNLKQMVQAPIFYDNHISLKFLVLYLSLRSLTRAGVSLDIMNYVKSYQSNIVAVDFKPAFLNLLVNVTLSPDHISL
jgi:hypothetical protein